MNQSQWTKVVLCCGLLAACGEVSTGEPPPLLSVQPAEPASCAVATSTDPAVVVTDSGALRSVVTDGVRAFRGVPYAAPPVGERRFRPPAAPACWSDIRDATTFAAKCTQSNLLSGTIEGQEDCLYLNVWSHQQGQNKPVMVYLHGGGNVSGASSLAGYDGHFLARHGDVVVVTLNYRLGAFGFLTHPDFKNENANGENGNWGLQDQIAALKWIQRNIAAFGGDPSRVMLFGQSAGGIDTCALLASPLTEGLFSRAGIMSGRCDITPAAIASHTTQVAISELGCDGTDDIPQCLRSKDAALLAQLPGATATAAYPAACFTKGCMYNQPTVDGVVLPDEPLNLIAANPKQNVSVVIGTTAHEGTLTVDAFLRELLVTPADYVTVTDAVFGSNAALFRQQYPLTNYSEVWLAMADGKSDVDNHCPTNKATAQMVASGLDVYRYIWAHTDSSGRNVALGATHGSDIPYIFQTHGRQLTVAEQVLSLATAAYWVNFARTGDPNGANLPAWPRSSPLRPYLQLATTASIGYGWRGSECAILDTVSWPRYVPLAAHNFVPRD